MDNLIIGTVKYETGPVLFGGDAGEAKGSGHLVHDYFVMF
jgi:hypothetical protein